jgi:hypothetical protein
MSNGEGKNGEFDGITYLYIRTNPADNGNVPLAPGLEFWISPDITIIQPGGMHGYEAIVDGGNQVEVIVTNAGGIPAVDAYVEVFLADPSTAFSPATATPLGGDFISIDGYNTKTFTLSWVPTVNEAGHRCLLARVCLSMPPDCYSNPAIFDVVGDRHVAQRNINVLKIKEKSMSFGFLVVNPLPGQGEFLVTATELKVGRKGEMIRTALGCDFAQFATAPLPDIRLNLSEPLAWEGGRPTKELRTPLTGRFRKPVDLPSRFRGKVAMAAGEVRPGVITLSRNPEVRPGDIHVVQVTQMHTKTRRTIGGLWLIVQPQ